MFIKSSSSSSALILLFLILLASATFAQLYYSKLHQKVYKNGTTYCTKLNQDFIQKEINDDYLEVEISPAVYSPEYDFEIVSANSNIIEIYSKSDRTIEEKIQKFCHFITNEIESNVAVMTRASANKPEVIKLIESGLPNNRIDVVFMGDGYKLEERTKFISDIKRLIKETLESETFSQFLPLLNVWVIFVPSVQSGIGYNGKPNNTPFKLYRNPGTFRGIFTKNPKFARQICKLTGPSGCDYPTLIGNDEFYGGLGGEFAIATSSIRAGAAVLRHEFGHNFAKVGEEYDNGEIYSGVNSSPSLRNLKWKSWLSNYGNMSGGSSSPREERMIYRILAYPQNDLDKRPLIFKFRSDGSYSRWSLTLTLSGAGGEDSVQFLLDGQPLTWKSGGTEDKEFYSWENPSGFSRGLHNLTIRSKIPQTSMNNSSGIFVEGIRIARSIGSVALYEYGSELEFNSGRDFISAYPTWDFKGRKRFRPTNSDCLMRTMSHDDFCSVCKESIWLHFMRRVSLIDKLEIDEERNLNGSRNVRLRVLKLGQFREVGTSSKGEKLEIKWIKNGVEEEGLKNLLEIKAEQGRWVVSVRLITFEVRNDPKDILSDKINFSA